MEGLIVSWIPPLVEIFIISTALSLGTTYAYKFLTDQAVMREMKSQINSLKEKIKAHKGDFEKQQEIQKEMMPLNMKYLKMSMKPTLITLVPFLLIFAGLGSLYGETVIVGPWGFSIPLIGNSLEWIGTYIIFSLIFTTVFRKVLKVV